MDIFWTTDESNHKIIEQSSHYVETSLLCLEKYQEWLNRHKYLLSSNIVPPIVPLLKKKIRRTELEDRVLKSLSENEEKKENKKEKWKKFSKGEETLFNALLNLYLSKSIYEYVECLECVADKIRYINFLQSCKKPVLPPALFQLINHLKKIHIKSERLFLDQKGEICKEVDADQFKNSVARAGMKLKDEDMVDILALMDTGYKNIISLEKFKQALKHIEEQEETLQILERPYLEKHELPDTSDEKKDVKKHQDEHVIRYSLLQVMNRTSTFSREQSLSEAGITERKLTQYPAACGHCCKIFRKYVPEPPVVHKEECIGILKELWLLWNRKSIRHCSLKKFEFLLRNMPGLPGEKPACRCPCHQIGLESVTLPMTNAEFLEYKRGEYSAEMERRKAAQQERKKQNKIKKEEILRISESQHSELIEEVEPEYEYYLSDEANEQHTILTDFVKTWLAYKTSEQDDNDATYSAYPVRYSHYFQNDVFHHKHIAHRYHLDPFEEVKGMTRSQWENISRRQELTTDDSKLDTNVSVQLLEEIKGTYFALQELSSIPQIAARQRKEVKTQEHTKKRRRCVMGSNLFQSTFVFAFKSRKPENITSIQRKQKEEEKKEIKFIKSKRKDKTKERRKEEEKKEIKFITNKRKDKTKRRRKEEEKKEIKFINDKQRKRRLPIYSSRMDGDLENRRFPEIDDKPEVGKAEAIFNYIPYYCH